MQLLSGDPARWVRRYSGDTEPRLRLLLLAHAGGGANAYRGWRAALPARIELCAVQLPGREERLGEPAFRQMEPLIDALALAVAPLIDRPFALFGHSMGALVAVALARKLRDQLGRVPVDFVASGYSAPAALRRRPRPLHLLPRDELIAELTRMGGTPREVLAAPVLLDLLLPTLRADLEVAETWSAPPAPALATPLLAVAGQDDASVSEDALNAWRVETSASFAALRLPGDHFYAAPGQRALLERLHARLAPFVR